jgi:predicted RNase H-like HicB family nuclease
MLTETVKDAQRINVVLERDEDGCFVVFVSELRRYYA